MNRHIDQSQAFEAGWAECRAAARPTAADAGGLPPLPLNGEKFPNYAQFTGNDMRQYAREAMRTAAVGAAHLSAADPIKEKISVAFDWDQGRQQYLTATEILARIGYDKPNKVQAVRASRALTRLAGEPMRNANGRYFHMPPDRPAAEGAADREGAAPKPSCKVCKGRGLIGLLTSLRCDACNGTGRAAIQEAGEA
jgi:hypothetical protein